MEALPLPAEAARAERPLRLLLQPNGLMLEVNQAPTVVGRGQDANLRLPLPDVSRRHCRLVFQDQQWHVEDMESLNGVYVNDVRVQNAVLQHHDLLRIGGFLFRVDLQSSTATLPMPAEEQRVLRDIADVLAPPSRKAS